MEKKSKKVPLTPADIAAAERLRAIWDRRPDPKNMTQDAAGVLMDMSQGAVSHYLNKKVALGALAVTKFANLLGCDPRQIRNDLPEIDEILAAGRARIADGSSVAMYDAYAGAGTGYPNGQFTRIGELTFRVGSLEKKGIDPARADIHFVAGRSMEPRLYDGDAILFDTRETSVASDGKMYVIDWNGERFVKRLFRELDGSVRVASDNKAPEFQDRIVRPGDGGFTVVGRVRWVGSWEH